MHVSQFTRTVVNKGLTKKTKGSNTLRFGFYKSRTYALSLNVRIFAIRYLHLSKKLLYESKEKRFTTT